MEATQASELYCHRKKGKVKKLTSASAEAYSVADPAFELRMGLCSISLSQPAFLPSVISSFSQKIGGARPLDPSLLKKTERLYRLTRKELLFLETAVHEAFPPLCLRKTFQSADRPRCTEVADELRRTESKLDLYPGHK